IHINEYYFFNSSRRRHTRSKRDWSSDVCTSDLVFSAHGVSPAVRDQARQLELKTFDATCPLVTKVHHEVTRFAKQGYQIILIGHHGHEEVEGTAGEAPHVVHLVEDQEDVDKLEFADDEKLVWLSQTTLSVDETMSTVKMLRE